MKRALVFVALVIVLVVINEGGDAMRLRSTLAEARAEFVASRLAQLPFDFDQDEVDLDRSLEHARRRVMRQSGPMATRHGAADHVGGLSTNHRRSTFSTNPSAVASDVDFAPVNAAIAQARKIPGWGGFLPMWLRAASYLSLATAIGGVCVISANRPRWNQFRGLDDSDQARRVLLRCVILLLALNLADLIYTTCLMPNTLVELNPLAKPLLLKQPLVLAGLKLVIPGSAALVFLMYWRYRLVQFASWAAASTYVGVAAWWAIFFQVAKS